MRDLVHLSHVVTILHRTIALLMVALWLPITSHCYLEDAGILKNDAGSEWCADANSHPGNADPCDSGCKMVEKTGFKFQEDERQIAPTVISAVIVLLSTPSKLSPPSPEVFLWPPDSLHLVHYIAQTALSPRAPSLVS